MERAILRRHPRLDQQFLADPPGLGPDRTVRGFLAAGVDVEGHGGFPAVLVCDLHLQSKVEAVVVDLRHDARGLLTLKVLCSTSQYQSPEKFGKLWP